MSEVKNMDQDVTFLHAASKIGDWAKDKNDLLLKIAKSSDPIKELGPGINSLLSYMNALFFLFMFIFFVNLPLMKDYYEQGFFYGSKAGGLAEFTLGNVGFAETECFKSISLKQEELFCKAGVITKLVDWGIKVDYEDQYKCIRY